MNEGGCLRRFINAILAFFRSVLGGYTDMEESLLLPPPDSRLKVPALVATPPPSVVHKAGPTSASLLTRHPELCTIAPSMFVPPLPRKSHEPFRVSPLPNRLLLLLFHPLAVQDLQHDEGSALESPSHDEVNEAGRFCTRRQPQHNPKVNIHNDVVVNVEEKEEEQLMRVEGEDDDEEEVVVDSLKCYREYNIVERGDEEEEEEEEEVVDSLKCYREYNIVERDEEEEEEEEEVNDEVNPRCCTVIAAEVPLVSASLHVSSASEERPKRVRFADSLGLDLFSIRHFDSIESPPERSPCSAAGGPWPTRLDGCFLEPRFVPPASRLGFPERLLRQRVCFESLDVADSPDFVRGSVLVLNLAYEKTVHVRYTFDRWDSYCDVLSVYVPSCGDGRTDRFVFSLPLPLDLEAGSCLQFALRYRTAGAEFWDNNHGEDYCVCVHRVSRCPARDSESWITFF